MEVKIYTSPTCFHCKDLIKKLNDNNIKFENIFTDTLKSEEIDYLIQEAKTSSLPIITLNNRFVSEEELFEIIPFFIEDTKINKIIRCHDCDKELTLNNEGEIIDGKLLKYEKDENKFIDVYKCNECFNTDHSLRNYQETEVYSRVVGYIRPVNQWNDGKAEEFKVRKTFDMEKVIDR